MHQPIGAMAMPRRTRAEKVEGGTVAPPRDVRSGCASGGIVAEAAPSSVTGAGIFQVFIQTGIFIWELL